jgi:hypothetical protein
MRVFGKTFSFSKLLINRYEYAPVKTEEEGEGDESTVVELKTLPRPGVTLKKKQEDAKQDKKSDDKTEKQKEQPKPSKPSMTGFALDDDDDDEPHKID